MLKTLGKRFVIYNIIFSLCSMFFGIGIKSILIMFSFRRRDVIKIAARNKHNIYSPGMSDTNKGIKITKMLKKRFSISSKELF